MKYFLSGNLIVSLLNNILFNLKYIISINKHKNENSIKNTIN
jgi:hypothetical protein